MMGEKRHTTYRGTKITFTADFSSETIQATRKWSDIFKIPGNSTKKTIRTDK